MISLNDYAMQFTADQRQSTDGNTKKCCEEYNLIT